MGFPAILGQKEGGVMSAIGPEKEPPEPDTLRARGDDNIYRIGLAVVLGLYFAIYGTLLWVTGSQPFVMDNNESWSVLWHASNIANFSFSESFGLADESFSPAAGAHPFVHTHQGNFPRLFGFLIYVLGADTIEYQVAVTTFTIGAVAIWLGYRFFSGLVGPVFAFLVMALFMGDYLLFAQWQVNTYRVWQGFLLFATLNCVVGLGEARWRPYAGFTVATFAALYYSEIVFTAFVSAFSGLFAIVLYWHQFGKLFRFVLLSIAGGSLSVLLLVGQLVGYLGWDGFLKDIQLTFFSRNFAKDPDSLRMILERFYDQHNVAFWFNIGESSHLLSVSAFLRSFFRYDLQVLTPFLTFVMIAVLGAFSLAMLVETRLWRFLSGWVSALLPSPMLGLVPLWYLFLVNIPNGATFLANTDTQLLVIHPSLKITILAAVGSMILSALLIYVSKLSSQPVEPRENQRFMAVVAYLAMLTLYFLYQYRLFDNRFISITQELFDRWDMLKLSLIALTLLVFLGAGLILSGARNMLGPQHGAQMAKFFQFLSLGGLAYGVIYLIFPGYIYSGYLERTVPFTVFLVVPALAATFFILGLVVYSTLGPLSGRVREFRESLRLGLSTWYGAVSDSDVAKFTVGVAALAGGTVALGYWGVLQQSYVALFPPQHYDFLKIMRNKPYIGRTAVVNNYSAPVAAATGAWAYYDSVIEFGRVKLTREGYKLHRDARTYLWFADRKMNRDYLRPDLFVCMIPQSRAMVASILNLRKNAKAGETFSGCEATGLVSQALKNEKSSPGHRLLVLDREGLQQRGYAAWAVVEFNYDFPPYLRPMRAWQGRNYAVDISAGPVDESGRTLSLKYEALSQQEGTAADVDVRVILRGKTKACGDRETSSEEIKRGTNLRSIQMPADFAGIIQVVAVPKSGSKIGREGRSPLLRLAPGEFQWVKCSVPVKKAVGTGLKVIRDTPTLAHLTWNPDPLATGQDVLLRSGCGSFRSVGRVDRQVARYSVGDLGPAVTYAFKVNQCYRGRCVDNSDVATAVAENATPLACPQPRAPKGVTARRLTGSSILLGWESPRRKATYRLEMQKDCGILREIALPNAEYVRYSIGSLAAKSTYSFRLRECIGGACAAYSPLKVIPPMGKAARNCRAPQPPAGISVVRTKAKEIRLKWSPGPYPSTYAVEMAKNCGLFNVIGHIESNRGMYRVGDLGELGAYRFRLRECTGLSCSEPSEVLVVPGPAGPVQSCSGGGESGSWVRQWIR